MHCNAEFYYVGKIPRTDIRRPWQQRRVVLRRRNTVVGAKSALPSALLVFTESQISDLHHHVTTGKHRSKPGPESEDTSSLVLPLKQMGFGERVELPQRVQEEPCRQTHFGAFWT